MFGRECAPWEAHRDGPYTSAHTSPTQNPGSGLDANMCRSPDGKPGVWCFIEGDNWEYCDVAFEAIPQINTQAAQNVVNYMFFMSISLLILAYFSKGPRLIQDSYKSGRSNLANWHGAGREDEEKCSGVVIQSDGNPTAYAGMTQPASTPRGMVLSGMTPMPNRNVSVYFSPPPRSTTWDQSTVRQMPYQNVQLFQNA
eukprot:508228_1